MNKKIIWPLMMLVIAFGSWLIQEQSASWYTQPVLKIEQVTEQAEQQQLTGTIQNGTYLGNQVTVNVALRSNEVLHPLYEEGQQLILNETATTVLELKRDGWVFFLLSLFVLCLLWIGGQQGLGALIGLISNTGLLLFLTNLQKSQPQVNLLLLMTAFTVFAIVNAMFFSYGWGPNSWSKIAAITLSVGGAFAICYVTMNLLDDRGLRYEEMQFVTRPYRSVFASSLLIGAIGASMDTVVSIYATLEEIQLKYPQVSLKRLFISGQMVGQDIAASMINVLMFAYLAGSLPMLLFYLKNGWPVLATLNFHLSLEFLRSLAGGFAIVLAVPASLVTFVGAQRLKRSV
ncbi:MAG: YibE/F family protein [Enterococcus sp.]